MHTHSVKQWQLHECKYMPKKVLKKKPLQRVPKKKPPKEPEPTQPATTQPTPPQTSIGIKHHFFFVPYDDMLSDWGYSYPGYEE